MAATPVIPLPLRRAAERRRDVRIAASMPLQVDGRAASTLDLSEHGLAFESESALREGDKVQLVVDYLLDGHHYPMQCEGEVVRVEPRGNRWLVAARLVAGAGLLTGPLPADAGDAPRHLRPVD
jgi:hypothetical protein